MKMKILIIIVLLLIGTVKNLNAQTFGGGDGLTKATAWEIYTKAHLQELSDFIIQTAVRNPARTNGTEHKHFRLMNDITDSVDFVIGGGSMDFEFYFMGYFYGGGHKITLAINPNSSLQRVALFGGVRRGGIDSLEVDGYVIKNYTSSNCQVAGIVADFYIPWHLSNDDGYLSNNINNATVTSNTRSYAVAGIAATANGGGIFFNCKNHNTVTGNANYLGGISGFVMSATISYSMNSGALINTINTSEDPNSSTGGICGYLAAGNANISNSLNLNIVKGYNKVGGIAGSMNTGNTSISNCINYSFTKGTSNVGGILGFMNGNYWGNGGTVSNNSNFGVVEGDSNVGCIVGLKNGGTVENNHYDTQMCGEED